MHNIKKILTKTKSYFNYDKILVKKDIAKE